MTNKNDYYEPIYTGDNVYINPTYFVLKSEYIYKGWGRSKRQLATVCNLKDNKAKGQLSDKARGNLRNSINWLIHSAKGQQIYSRQHKKLFKAKITFVTLTIPPQQRGMIKNDQFKTALNSFLTYSRKYFYLSNYVWKVEAHKDGRLHMHLTTDTFIHHAKLRSAWNRILQRQGMLDFHYKKFGNYNPNSTDIHSVRKVGNLASYLCAYMAKKTDLDSSFKGKIWGTSQSLSASRKVSVFIDSDFKKRDYSFVDRPAVKYLPINTKPDAMGNVTKIANLFLLGEKEWNNDMEGVIKDAYSRRLRDIRDSHKESPDEYRQLDIETDIKWLKGSGSSSISGVNDSDSSNNNLILAACETKKTTPIIGQMRLGLEY